jgi:predicted nucleic acid-binding protein
MARRAHTLPVVDGVIAATALHHDLTILTRNVKDFRGLGADVFNPWDDSLREPSTAP